MNDVKRISLEKALEFLGRQNSFISQVNTAEGFTKQVTVKEVLKTAKQFYNYLTK